MCRVLEVEKPWLFRDDMVLVVDGARHGLWAEPLHLATMWVQLHNVPPLNMTKAVALAIVGLIGKVVKVDKDDGRDCISRFLRVKISFDVREPLMSGANVEFPNYGTMWVDFRYMGYRTIVSFVARWGMSLGGLETNSKILVDMLNGVLQPEASWKVLNGILTILNYNYDQLPIISAPTYWKFLLPRSTIYARCEANGAAHHLARTGLGCGE
ncbi:hypothetical protein D8674_013096 [Pyrus ussuriensis x Pyrus communis]|uniref:Uncharacterized protein n=1 Tax=Pyrus ussuriensis x Pyrus communis TaxID=2448454 RepID=A0A5N5GQ03_9ROSA|nr:hypothetical protein D8674_013096 [Pyrus ussuriensis x Pyrus communis]